MIGSMLGGKPIPSFDELYPEQEEEILDAHAEANKIKAQLINFASNYKHKG